MDQGGDISRLAGFVPEPYIKERVLAAARRLRQPFTLAEVRAETRLSPQRVGRVIDRAIKSGLLERWPVPMLRHAKAYGPQRTYLYRFVDGNAE